MRDLNYLSVNLARMAVRCEGFELPMCKSGKGSCELAMRDLNYLSVSLARTAVRCEGFELPVCKSGKDRCELWGI